MNIQIDTSILQIHHILTHNEFQKKIHFLIHKQMKISTSCQFCTHKFKKKKKKAQKRMSLIILVPLISMYFKSQRALC